MRILHPNIHLKESYLSRRDFILTASSASLGMMGLGTFLQSCAEKEIVITTEHAKAYIKGLLEIIKKIRERELQSIKKAASFAIQTRLQGHKIYAHLSGGMVPNETNVNRPGSPGLFITENIQKASRDDLLVTNDPEAARGFGEMWIKVVGITTPLAPTSNTPPGTLENMGVLRIEDVSDIVINCHVPYTDGILKVEGIEIPICPASSVIHSLIYFALAAEIIEGLTQSGIYPKIG